VKIIDFGHARIQLKNQDAIHNTKQPFTSLFQPFKDKSNLATCLQTRVKLAGTSEQDQNTFRDFMKKMRSTTSYTPTELLDHDFFSDMRYIPNETVVDWDSQLEYTFGDVDVFERLVLGRDDRILRDHIMEQGQDIITKRRRTTRNKK
jgi:hypothetical protein